MDTTHLNEPDPDGPGPAGRPAGPDRSRGQAYEPPHLERLGSMAEVTGGWLSLS